MFIYLYRLHAGHRSLTAKQLLRFNISDRAAAIILNTYLYEEGLITEIDLGYTVIYGITV